MITQCYEAVLELDPLNAEFELSADCDEDYIIYAIAEEDSEFLLDITNNEEYLLEIQDEDALDFILESGCAIITYIDTSVYDGPYHLIPTQHEQRLFTTDRILLQDITVDAIPSNYGLITWNGTVLTVS